MHAHRPAGGADADLAGEREQAQAEPKRTSSSDTRLSSVVVWRQRAEREPPGGRHQRARVASVVCRDVLSREVSGQLGVSSVEVVDRSRAKAYQHLIVFD